MAPGTWLGVYPLKMAFLGHRIFLDFFLTSLIKVSSASEWLKNFSAVREMLMGKSIVLP